MKTFSLILALAVSITAVAETQTWKIDPNHTASQFAVKHMGISTVRGVFEKTTGEVMFDPADPSKSSIDVTIDTNSVNTRVQMRDNDLRSPHFFDVAKFPTITFKSTHVEAAGSGKLKVTGDLTIHGVTKPVVLDVDGPSQEIKGPMGDLRVGANATTKIDRKDFGITADPGVIGDEIQITLDVELTRPAK
ncbi:MAG TPA: YceI family protein [Terriglobales bacterium]|nr:YceI family protein [Terriglobales bacterium]